MEQRSTLVTRDIFCRSATATASVLPESDNKKMLLKLNCPDSLSQNYHHHRSPPVRRQQQQHRQLRSSCFSSWSQEPQQRPSPQVPHQRPLLQEHTTRVVSPVDRKRHRVDLNVDNTDSLIEKADAVAHQIQQCCLSTDDQRRAIDGGGSTRHQSGDTNKIVSLSTSAATQTDNNKAHHNPEVDRLNQLLGETSGKLAKLKGDADDLHKLYTQLREAYQDLETQYEVLKNKYNVNKEQIVTANKRRHLSVKVPTSAISALNISEPAAAHPSSMEMICRSNHGKTQSV